MAPQIPSVLAAVSAPCSPALGALSMPGTMAPLSSKALWWALSWECCSIPCTRGERSWAAAGRWMLRGWEAAPALPGVSHSPAGLGVQLCCAQPAPG